MSLFFFLKIPVKCWENAKYLDRKISQTDVLSNVITNSTRLAFKALHHLDPAYIFPYASIFSK